MTDARAIKAAQNNADWYAMMWDIHGLRYQRTDGAFCAADGTPPYHSWATVTATDATAMDRLEPYMDHPEFGVKDRHDDHDWSDHGLTKFFEARWIWAAGFGGSTQGWEQIKTPAQLDAWEAAWRIGSPSDRQQFPAAILDRDDVKIWGRRTAQGYDSGVIGNLSEDCVGLSNCFGQDALPAAAALCTVFGDGLPIVGYERGNDLQDALALGFADVGRLSVWVKPRDTQEGTAG